MSDFDRIEERREQLVNSLGTAFEDTTDEEEAAFREEFGYAENDPKHPTYHDRYADLWDMREGK